VRTLLTVVWLRGLDSNQQPPGYEPDELPVAPPRCCNYTTSALPVQVDLPPASLRCYTHEKRGASLCFAQDISKLSES
jgi:hypothetical protein